MTSIYKKDGSPYWWVCYCADGKKRDKSLKVRNKEVAIRLRNKIEEQIVLGEAGLFIQDGKPIDEFIPIFIDYVSKRNSKGTLDRYSRFFDKIGVKGSVRKFRDTYASYSLACGMPLQNLKDNLGHSDIRTTQIYLQVVPRIKSEEIKTLFNSWK